MNERRAHRKGDASARTVRVGVSACLLGEKVRYDGEEKGNPVILKEVGRFVEWVPLCPEVGMGLPVPREAMRLVGEAGAPRLVEIRTGRDRTDPMRKWSADQVRNLEEMNLCGFIFKSRSPSCGLEGVAIYTPEGLPVGTGRGLFAAAFMNHFPGIPVEEEGRLQDPALREQFLEGVFDFKREKQGS